MPGEDGTGHGESVRREGGGKVSPPPGPDHHLVRGDGAHLLGGLDGVDADGRKIGVIIMGDIFITCSIIVKHHSCLK